MLKLKQFIKAFRKYRPNVNLQNSFKFLNQELQAGNKFAWFTAAEFYEEGTSLVAKNLAFAYAAYYISDKKGHKEAAGALTSIREKMSPEQLEEAEKIIAEQKPETLRPNPTLTEKIKVKIAKSK